MRHEYLTLEHLLLALTKDARLAGGAQGVRREHQAAAGAPGEFLEETVERLPEDADAEPQQTIGGGARAAARGHPRAVRGAEGDGRRRRAGRHLPRGRSHALYLLQQEGVTRLDILNYISHGISKEGTSRRGRR